MIERTCLLFALAASVPFAAGCNDSGDTGGGGSGSTVTSTTSGTTTATSSGAGCTGTDANEPDEDFHNPAFINDASAGITCGATPLAGSGQLADATDIDAWKIYTDSQTCAGAAPKVTVNTANPIDVCFYIDGCTPGTLPLLTCAANTHGEADTALGITGCCGKIDSSGSISLPGAQTCTDVNVKLYVKFQNASACSNYSFTVGL